MIAPELEPPVVDGGNGGGDGGSEVGRVSEVGVDVGGSSGGISGGVRGGGAGGVTVRGGTTIAIASALIPSAAETEAETELA